MTQIRGRGSEHVIFIRSMQRRDWGGFSSFTDCVTACPLLHLSNPASVPSLPSYSLLVWQGVNLSAFIISRSLFLSPPSFCLSYANSVTASLLFLPLYYSSFSLFCIPLITICFSRDHPLSKVKEMSENFNNVSVPSVQHCAASDCLIHYHCHNTTVLNVLSDDTWVSCLKRIRDQSVL